jgi:hypothetical protein
MGEIIKWIHHGKEVFTDEDQMNQHRIHCLCFRCKLLNTEDREKNCPIANKLFVICVESDITAPVFECPKFLNKENRN